MSRFSLTLPTKCLNIIVNVTSCDPKMQRLLIYITSIEGSIAYYILSITCSILMSFSFDEQSDCNLWLACISSPVCFYYFTSS